MQQPTSYGIHFRNRKESQRKIRIVILKGTPVPEYPSGKPYLDLETNRDDDRRYLPENKKLEFDIYPVDDTGPYCLHSYVFNTKLDFDFGKPGADKKQWKLKFKNLEPDDSFHFNGDTNVEVGVEEPTDPPIQKQKPNGK